MLAAIENFAGKEMPFRAITIDWHDRIEKHWILQGKGKSTMCVYFKLLKAILNRAKLNGMIKETNFPFDRGRFEIPLAEGRKLALMLE